jgi:hypothetical protein
MENLKKMFENFLRISFISKYLLINRAKNAINYNNIGGPKNNLKPEAAHVQTKPK